MTHIYIVSLRFTHERKYVIFIIFALNCFNSYEIFSSINLPANVMMLLLATFEKDSIVYSYYICFNPVMCLLPSRRFHFPTVLSH